MSDTALKIIVAGSSEFTTPALAALLESPYSVIAAYTQPDRPSGRGRKLARNVVKQMALDHDVPVYQPINFKSSEIRAALKQLGADLMVVAAYGLILPQSVLDTPEMGCWNLHGSLLPSWRGAAPVQRAIIAGDSVTGVTLMQMNAGLDTGDMLAAVQTLIETHDTGGSLHDRLAQLGATLLMDSLNERHALNAEPQPEAGVSYAHKLSKAEALIDWQEPAELLARKVRAFNPWPVSHADLRGDHIRLWDAHALPEVGPGSPGNCHSDEDSLKVTTADGTLCITSLQRAGGKRLSARDFLNGNPSFR